jgi:hypothetical protein
MSLIPRIKSQPTNLGSPDNMNTYTVTQDGARFEVRAGGANGPVVATFSNRLAAETFAEKQRVKDQGTPKTQSENGRA